MSKTDFEKLNHEKEQSNEKLFSNPRNATTGSLMHLDVNITASRNLSFFAYSMYDINEFYNFKYHSDCLNLLHNLGFKVNQYNKIVHSKNEILQYYNEAIDYRYNLNYDIDGIVYKVDSLLEQKQLGSTGKYPKWAIAYKFPAEIALSKIKDIVIQVGRTGVLTPVAILDSVNIGGVMVSKASLHNQDEINRKDIRIGDIVEVKRAGDVIPYVEKVMLDKRTHNLLQFQYPKNCPVCGSLVEKNGIKIFCNNKFECKSQKIEAIYHFVSKPAFNIQGLGKKQVEQLYNISILNNISDIFELDDKKKIILQQEGWGILSFNNLIDSINKSKEVELYRFIYALGVPNVGIESAKLLANHFKDINKLIEVISIIRQSDFEYNRLSSINGFGNIVLDNIIDFFNNENNIKQIHNILEYINIAKVEEIKEVVADEFFNEKKFVISGTYDNFSRDYIKEQILLRGGKVITSVSKSLDYLIAGDNVGVKKLDKANELNIKIITKEDILSRLKLL